MFKVMLTRMLTHLVSQNEWAKPMLLPYASMSVRFVMLPVSATLVVLEDGGLAMAGEAADPDATINLPFSTAIRLLANDEAAINDIAIDGHAELAAAIARVLRNMSWKVEEDLSHVIGDVTAHQVGEFSRKLMNETKKQSLNVAQMLAEYWQEEQPLIAKKRHVEEFVSAVDTFREDVSRFEKRLEKLAEKITHSNLKNSSENLTK